MKTMLGGQVLPVTYVSDGLLANLQYAFLIGIDSTYCNGRKIEKSSKSVERQTDMVVDYAYQYNVVEDSDIVKPDITDAIVHE